nr:hypothetical protein [Anaerolineae bacterium]
LTGYTLAQSGAAVTLDTFWQVTGDPAPLAAFTFTPTAHLFAAGGERLQVMDGTALPARLWQPGDRLRQRFEITLPGACPCTLRIGQYDGVQQRGLIFILPDSTYTDLIPLPLELRP